MQSLPASDDDRPAWVTEAEQRRKARPLAERLRDSGPFTASDGNTSVRFPDLRDVHEAADVLDRLRTLEWAGSTDRDTCPVPECGVIFTGLHAPRHAPDCWLAEAIGAPRDE